MRGRPRRSSILPLRASRSCGTPPGVASTPWRRVHFHSCCCCCCFGNRRRSVLPRSDASSPVAARPTLIQRRLPSNHHDHHDYTSLQSRIERKFKGSFRREDAILVFPGMQHRRRRIEFCKRVREFGQVETQSQSRVRVVSIHHSYYYHLLLRSRRVRVFLSDVFLKIYYYYF